MQEYRKRNTAKKY